MLTKEKIDAFYEKGGKVTVGMLLPIEPTPDMLKSAADKGMSAVTTKALCRTHKREIQVVLDANLADVDIEETSLKGKRFKLILKCGDDKVETFVPFGEKVNAVEAFFEDHRHLKLPFGAIMKIRGHDIYLKVEDVNRNSGKEL